MGMRVLAFSLLTSTAVASPLGPNLYIADGQFTMEQALADAMAQRTPDDPPTWKMLVTDREAPRLIAAGASAATLGVMQKARAASGIVYVCAKDLKAINATPRDLIQGVHAVRGYLTVDSQVPDWERRLPWAPDRKSLAVCGGA
jgi:hypothetical protein